MASAQLDPLKFRDPHWTAKGERRADIAFDGLDVLWFNTGTLCNITCAPCYIDSSPKNDRLAYLTLADVSRYLDEIDHSGSKPREIGFTGGEPFMNPDILAILEMTLARGYQLLVLTNAMRPMRRFDSQLRALKDRFGAQLGLRVSLDDPDAQVHDLERGHGSFDIACYGISFLSDHGFRLAIAGRAEMAGGQAQARTRFQALFAEQGWRLDADDPTQLILFPEMNATVDEPEITTACWDILGKNPKEIMCASSRMIVRRKGADQPTVLACTLIVDDPAFDLGPTLAGAARSVGLNHQHCAKFCVLGGASCSA